MMKKLICLMMTLVMLLGSMAAMAEMAGGWTIPESTIMDDDAFEAFTGATDEECDLFPHALLAKQVVAGVNYAILCNTPKGSEIVYLYRDLSGKCELMREQVLVKTGTKADGNWKRIGEEGLSVKTLDGIEAALNGMPGMRVSEYYEMAQRSAKKADYVVLCRVIPEGSPEYWAKATVHQDKNGKMTVTEMQPVELSLSE